MLREALRQLPGHQSGRRPGRKVLVRIDGAGATHQVLDWLTTQRLSYSVGYGLPANTEKLLALLPKDVWQVAYDSDGSVRDGAWVAELTGLLDLTGWPKGMRVIARKERPHPGAQLRFTDADGLRVTALATNTARGQLADLELRHRWRARCEDRIRGAKDTGLTNLPLHDMDQNKIWCAVVSLACELTAWLQMLALHDHPARRWEPKRLRLRLFYVAGRLARSARRVVLHLNTTGRWTDLLLNIITTLRSMPASTLSTRPRPDDITPARGTDANRATSGELSHPHDTITLQQRASAAGAPRPARSRKIRARRTVKGSLCANGPKCHETLR